MEYDWSRNDSERKKMMSVVTRISPAVLLVALLYLPTGERALGAQAADNPGFRALPRPIRYDLPLAPVGGAKAVIVYGQSSAYAQKSAESVQKIIQEWSGLKLDVVADRTVTGEDTWLLEDEYRKTPMIVLGNAWENRVIHALGTRYLAQSNRSWPGGDRYLIRSIFEPFAADVNYLVLEASTQTGLEGAVAKLAELVKTKEFAKSSATVPRVRVVASVRDKWNTESCFWWKVPPEMADAANRSVTDLAGAYKGPVITAGDNFAKAGLTGEVFYYTLGGILERLQATQLPEDDAYHHATAAMYLLGFRAVGGRTHHPSDHYGAMHSIVGARGFMQMGFLSEAELNEFENAFVLSAAQPNEYFYDHIGNFTGIVSAWGGRHFMACLLLSLHTQDYVLHHCHLDDRTRQEIQRRYDNARKCTAEYIRSFRNNGDGSCLGEDTMLQLYSLLHEGFLEHVRNGTLRQMADFYVLTSDNLYVGGMWPFYGCYAGLGGFACGPGGQMVGMVGRGSLDAAAFYYDDPQYRWLAKNWWGSKWTVPASTMNMHMDYEGPIAKPTMYNGVRSLPYDERMYRVIDQQQRRPRSDSPVRRAPESLDGAIDRVAFRDGLDPDDAYLFLATSQDHSQSYPAQNNSIARYTDLSELWLFANMSGPSTWSRSVVSVSNGKAYVPRVACQQEALANLGEVSAVSSREPDIAGADWTRTIVHWKSHYFAVLDRMQAQQPDDFAYVCRWRSLHPATLETGVWTARSNSGNVLRIQNTDSVFQTAEHWEVDGAAAPYVLQQYKQAKLNAGEMRTYQNLLYVSGAKRVDAFETRRAGATAMLVKGHTASGPHLALIGTAGGEFPLPDPQLDAEVYHLTGDLLHMASVRSIKLLTGGGIREVFWSQRPVNLLLNCASGQAELEVTDSTPVPVKAGSTWLSAQPGRATIALAKAGELPRLAPVLEALWTRCAAPAPTAAPPTDEGQVFQAIKAAEVLRRPLRKLTRFEVSSTPPSTPTNEAKYIWRDPSNLEVTVTLPDAIDVDFLRLVTPTKMVPLYGLGSEGYGTPHYSAGDFTFSLMLSDDGFQKDIRTIEQPQVTLEETSEVYVGHFTKSRLPVWRIAVNAKAKQIKVLPRATTPERAVLYVKWFEVLQTQHVDELTLQALAADINGDGANELVLGTSECQLAAYDSDGQRLWIKDTTPGAIHLLAAGDLEEDGKSEVLAYLTTEVLRRIDGDGSERPAADITAAQLKYNQQRAGGGNITSLGVWGRGDPQHKEVFAWAEGLFRVQPDGTTILESGKIQHPQGVGRLVNLFPGEPEALGCVNRYGLNVFSSRLDAQGNYRSLGYKTLVGPDSGESRGLGLVQGVDVPGFKGVVVAIEGQAAAYPIASFLPPPPGAKAPEGWQYGTGGVPAVAALVEDLDGDGVPEVFLARVDGFVNVLKLADGSLIGLMSTGQPIVGMAVLKGRDGKPCLAVGTKFGVHLFAADPNGYHKLGSTSLPIAAFAGPGGPHRDRVYVVDPAGCVRVLVLESKAPTEGRKTGMSAKEHG
jgi:hypothetical protein